MSLTNIYLIVGPSGSGKTTLANELSERYHYKQIESYTTRPPRFDGEKGHIFVSDEEFDALGPMCAFTKYDGHRYGVTKDLIDENDLYVIDPEGVRYMKSHYFGEKGVRVIRLMVSEYDRRMRMTARGDDLKKITDRILQDERVFSENDRDICYDLILPAYDVEKEILCIKAFIDCCEAEHDCMLDSAKRFVRELERVVFQQGE